MFRDRRVREELRAWLAAQGIRVESRAPGPEAGRPRAVSRSEREPREPARDVEVRRAMPQRRREREVSRRPAARDTVRVAAALLAAPPDARPQGSDAAGDAAGSSTPVAGRPAGVPGPTPRSREPFAGRELPRRAAVVRIPHAGAVQAPAGSRRSPGRATAWATRGRAPRTRPGRPRRRRLAHDSGGSAGASKRARNAPT